jgi:hypothetical protein
MDSCVIGARLKTELLVVEFGRMQFMTIKGLFLYIFYSLFSFLASSSSSSSWDDDKGRNASGSKKEEVEGPLKKMIPLDF